MDISYRDISFIEFKGLTIGIALPPYLYYSTEQVQFLLPENDMVYRSVHVYRDHVTRRIGKLQKSAGSSPCSLCYTSNIRKELLDK
jgi:hypothetical protein